MAMASVQLAMEASCQWSEQPSGASRNSNPRHRLGVESSASTGGAAGCAKEPSVRDGGEARRAISHKSGGNGSPHLGLRGSPHSSLGSTGLQAANCHQRLYLLLEDPDSSLLARILSHIVLLTIVLSIAGFILQTVPSVQDLVLWDIIELGSTAIFTAEYFLRFIACSAFGCQTRLGFVRAPMNVLDLMAILPFYVERSLEMMDSIQAFRVLRSARLIRIFRVFKLSKYSLGMNLMVESLVNSVHPLSILTFFLCVGVLLFSSSLFYAERMSCPTIKDDDWQTYQAECRESSTSRAKNGDLCCDERGSPVQFPSIAVTFWWSIVTMTTVGYGDMVPRTGLGRVVAFFAMVCGIILISLPVAIVGAKFQQAYEEFKMDRQEIIAVNSMDSPENSLPSVEECDSPSSKAPAGQEGAGIKDEGGDTAKPLMSAIGPIRAKLKRMEKRSALTLAAQEQIQLLLELFDHLERAEKQLASLREKDKACDALIRKDFVALTRKYDVYLEAELGAY